MLPEEYPPAPAHAHSLRVLHDGLPVIAAGSVLGPASAALLTWSHKQGEKLAKALAPHVEKLGASMGRLALTVSAECFSSCHPCHSVVLWNWSLDLVVCCAPLFDMSAFEKTGPNLQLFGVPAHLLKESLEGST